jgi:hypothetical protein
MECLAANSSILEVTGSGLRGRLYISQGQITHGEIGDLSGVDALNSMLCLPGGSFELLPFTDPGRETISGQWEFLLMEAARVRDEAADAQPTVEEALTEEILPDAASIDAFSIAPEATPPEPEDPDAPPVPPAPSEPTTDTPEAGGEKAADTTTGMQPVIKETLICSLDGEVLYSWNCPDASGRVSLLEFITKRASGMTASLRLGAFERFESMEKGVRCVAKVDGDQALLIRVQSVLSRGPGASGTP